MSSWIVSIVSVVILMVMLDLFIGEGETKKYIKGIMSIIIIVVIIAPLPKILKKDYTINEVFQESSYTENEIKVDDSFLYRLYRAQYAKKEMEIQKYLASQGIKGSVVVISIAYGESGTVDITNVLISMENTVITEIDKNININEMIYDSVQSIISVQRERIIING